MARQNLNDGENKGVFRNKLNENFIDLYTDKHNHSNLSTLDEITFTPASQSNMTQAQSDISTNMSNISALQSEATSKWVLLNTVDNRSRSNESRIRTIEETGGIRGEDGLSAYEIWLAEGNIGTEQDFLDSLIGIDGKAATIKVREIITGEPETNANVENIGTENAAELKFTIPQGMQGERGMPGTGANIGEIFWWPLISPPNDSLYCDGRTISRSEYRDLFEIIGIQFGEGDGETTFNLPDLRGEFIRGYDPEAVRDPNGIERGIGNHQDSTNVGTYISTGYSVRVENQDGTASQSSVSRLTGGSTVSATLSMFRIRPTNINLMPCIRFKEHSTLNTKDLFEQWKAESTNRADVTFEEWIPIIWPNSDMAIYSAVFEQIRQIQSNQTAIEASYSELCQNAITRENLVETISQIMPDEIYNYEDNYNSPKEWDY